MLIDFWESNKRACSFNKLHESSKKHPGGDPTYERVGDARRPA